MRTRRDFALASLLLPVHVCLAQSLIGQEIGFEFLGSSISNQSGTLVVSEAGPEVVLTEPGRTYTIDFDATGVSFTVDIDPQVALNASFGTSSPFNELLRQVRLTGLRYDNGDSVVGVQISGDTDALPEDVFFDGDTLVIGSEERGELFTFRTGDTLRIDLEPDPCPGPNVVNTRTGEIFETILEAIDGAADGDVLELAACTFFERDIVVRDRNVRIRGAGIGQTVIDGQNQSPPIVGLRSGANATFSGITFQNGRSQGSAGPAVFIQDEAIAAFDHCEFKDNDSNGSSSGAALFHTSSGDLTVSNSVFRNNTNTNPGISSAVHLVVARGAATITNSLFAGGMGSGRQVNIRAGADADVVNCTFADFTGSSNILTSGDATARIINTVADGQANEFALVATGGSREIARSVFPGAIGDNIDGTAAFVDSGTGDYRLAPGSIGIDYADADAYAAAGGGLFDADGGARTADDRGTDDTGTGVVAILDAGAFEFRGRTLSLKEVDVNGDGAVDFFDILKQIRLTEAEL